MSKLAWIAVALLCLTSPVAAQPFHKTLISSSQNVRVDPTEITSKDATPNCPVKWSVRKLTLHGGKQEGVDLVVIDNGKLQITVIPTRGLGVLSVTLGDVRLGWDSPVKDVVHPQFVNLNSRGGLGFLEGFNEWMCRCGLENNGGPGPDRFINNIGDEAVMELTLHGKIANLPAQEVELVVDREAPYRIRLRGRVDERMLFGPKLELQTEISTEPGSNTFRIADVVSNRGTQPQEFEMLYHVNFGRPLLEEGSRFLAPVERVTPYNDRAAKAVATWNVYPGPTPGFIEQVYLLRPIADKDGRTLLLLQNKAADRAASMSYTIKELPCLTIWKNTAAEKDGYVTGLEPGTNYPNHRAIERKAGRVPKLAGDASHAMMIDYTIHVGKDEVQKAADRIKAIQGDRKPTIDEKPQ
jgi:Domain of unknown function (DUF4432)